MDLKIGVYIDTGYGIGEALDIESLSKVATKEMKVPICRAEAYWSDPDKLEIIKNDIANEGVNAIIVAGASPRVFQEAFRFEGVITERINLREQVIWSHPANDEDTQMLAEDYMRMGVTKLNKYEDRAPFDEANEKSILVIGGGITGMTAALEAARAGTQVYLVEKEPQLGGWATKYHKVFTGQAPYDSIVDSPVQDKIAAVKANSNIKVFTGHRVYSIAGSPGMFDVTIREDGPWIDRLVREQNEWLAAKKAKEAIGQEEEQKPKAAAAAETPAEEEAPEPTDFPHEKIQVGAVVLAAGWRPEDASAFAELGYGEYPDVITSVELEELAKNGKIKRPSDGKEVNTIAFIDTPNQKADHPLLFSSSVASLVALKQAHYLRQTNPESRAYIFYENMRTPGQYEKFYQAMQDDPGVFLSKGTPVGVSNGGSALTVELKDTLLGEYMKVKVDLLVLATGMVPVTKDSAIVNLKYRQGPFMPENVYGFNDSHFICFPYETQRTGIYTAGCVKNPMDFLTCEMDAAGAALKAIQCAELTAQGKAVSPRAGDESFPQIFLQRCTQCKRCTEECPFGAYDEKPDGTPLPNPTRCRRCAICMGSCPERLISFRDHSVDMIGSMVKIIDVPDEYSEKPRVVVFICENDAYPVVDMAGMNRLEYSPHVRFIPLRCLGNINMVWIADALSKGIDGIMLIGCKYGDDYQCHFVKGSELAEYRMSKISETLQRLALEPERISVHQLAIDEYNKLPKIIDEFMETLSGFDPNPYKGF
ncbi:FAD-dependent oxidoreductase [Desulfomonile tiedjei]|uniref:Polyferredoxin, heterodixulfide reductase subunit A n=1 Tax=Desulfomonile tiedjei (strain ATCC 49306 / DSM 6799 / DCB-1) TaxID=706587 RepID=I4C3L6_DESTA|nr:FAD-dependent oxidoreductase [Desulfomonile tiedjei]AFM24157.1 polyferredoxin, heterodixulfide reductase subunit A [Desulfomonile tiedjei DSM 6799]